MINTNPVTVWPSLLTSIPLIFIIFSYNVSVTLGFYVALADVYKYFTWGFHWFIKYMLKHRVGKCLTVGIVKSSLVKDITQVFLRYRWSKEIWAIPELVQFLSRNIQEKCTFLSYSSCFCIQHRNREKKVPNFISMS